MSREIATVIFAVGILALFLLDRDRKSRASPALWLPVAWVSIAGSRMLSVWLEGSQPMESPDQYLEGSPLDRAVLTGLLAASLMVLVARGQRAGTFLRLNGPILLFFLYGALSVFWSDYPEVAFKRWTKALGNVVMVLVVLTDPDPSAAVKRLLARTGFLLIPLSILLIKFYPELGRGYNRWTYLPFYSGVAEGKNGLGYICVVFGLASLWRFLEAFRAGESSGRAGSLIAHGAILAMVLWLLWMANSATSLACFLIGSGLIAITSLPGVARQTAAMHLLLVVVALLALSLVFLETGTLVEAMGRDATLTGRTVLWEELLVTNRDPWFGTGFESFWLGERAETFWRKYYWHPNQAHNGYLETFLNLGWAGVALLGLVIAWGYRNVVGAVVHRDPGTGRLRLAYFVVAVIYNLTEAAFTGMHLVWIVFFLAIIVVPEPPRQEHSSRPSKFIPEKPQEHARLGANNIST